MIVIIRLVSGYDVAGEIVHEDHRGVTLKYPLSIHYRFAIGGYPSTSFTKYQVFTDMDEVGFDKHNILNILPARESFEKFYLFTLDKYYHKLTERVDEELLSAIQEGTIDGDEVISEERLKEILLEIPTDHMTMN